MEIIYYFKKVVFENFANFRGRARRSEYWYFCLAMFIINMLMQAISTTDVEAGAPALNTAFYVTMGLSAIIYLFTLIPSIAVSVRRLHDYGKSGWWLLLGFVPLIGGIILLVWFCKEGTRGSNKWGPDPKNPDGEDEIMKAFEN